MENKTTKTIAVTIIISVLIIAGVAFGIASMFANKQFKETSTINTDGKSEMTFSPDQSRVWVGVSILKPTAAEAQTEANKAISNIIEALKNEGISAGDIETENFQLYEEKDYTQTGTKSKGWRASQTLKVKTTDFSKLGRITDIAINNKANEIQNIEFYLSPKKEAEYKQQVIAEATKNAKAKAQTIADSLGVTLGRIISVSESNYGYVPYAYQMKNVAGVDAVSEAAQVMPKDVTVSANVNIAYNVK